ncbi:hypothetical protein P9112_000942 [Eukaryota sp. TZLM1-RC]
MRSNTRKQLLISLAIDAGIGLFLHFFSMWWAVSIDPIERPIVSEYNFTIWYENKADIIDWRVLQVICHALILALTFLTCRLKYAQHFLLISATTLGTYIHGNGVYIILLSVLKTFAGRLRPDFVDRCQPDAKGVCTGDPDVVREGRVSWPSGHSGLTGFATVFALFLLNDLLKPFSAESFRSLRMLPLVVVGLLGILSGLSRNIDNHHHVGDIVCGLVLGGIVAVWAWYLRQKYNNNIVNKKEDQVALLHGTPKTPRTNELV